MFDTLFESNPKNERVIGGTVASVVAHAAVIAAAVFGTAQARVREEPRLGKLMEKMGLGRSRVASNL